ncbi:hypothetical protein MRB53_038269 [Persea americana]|nr:hypothetical protein MRB53_038269 [Persea americana]
MASQGIAHRRHARRSRTHHGLPRSRWCLHDSSAVSGQTADTAVSALHTTPKLNFTPITNGPQPLTLDNLDQLNALGGSNVYLSSVDDFSVMPSPAWLDGVVPDAKGKTEGVRSCAIIINQHGGSGIVDVFYMYFYPYNRGDVVLGQELGDHIGDWFTPLTD